MQRPVGNGAEVFPGQLASERYLPVMMPKRDPEGLDGTQYSSSYTNLLPQETPLPLFEHEHI